MRCFEMGAGVVKVEGSHKSSEVRSEQQAVDLVLHVVQLLANLCKLDGVWPFVEVDLRG
jgi:hypothetical protein